MNIEIEFIGHSKSFETPVSDIDLIPFSIKAMLIVFKEKEENILNIKINMLCI